MKYNKDEQKIVNTELAYLFENEETRYIEKTQRMPSGVKIWHPDEMNRCEEDD